MDIYKDKFNLRMLYFVFRPFVRWFYQLFYKRVYIQGVENIPEGKPVILAADHTNALVDPLMVAVFMKRSIHFLARADIFANKFLVWFFGQLHMRPIYRPRDGADYVEKNERIFDEVNQWLLSRKAVLIFSEGNCVSAKRLRPLKKGTVRMGFRAWESGADVHIVPTGINYTYHHEGRSEVIVSYGKPIRLEDYRASFEQNPAKAYRETNRDLAKAIKEEMIIIEKPETEDVAEQLLVIGRNDYNENRFPILAKNPRRLYYEQRITNKVNELFANAAEAYEDLKLKVETYHSKLEVLKTKDAAVRNSAKANSLFILILAPIARFFSIVFHFPYHFFKNKATEMTKNDQSMFMTMWSGFLIGFYIVLGFLWLIVGTIFLGPILSFSILIFIIFITYWSGVILEKRANDKANSDLEQLEIQKPEVVKELKDLRLELSNWIKS